MLDLLFKNATVIDGTGKPAFKADIGVREDRIVMNPQEYEAVRTIDAEGLTLAPGFIDFHSHGDAILGKDYANLCKVSQGVTTQICGQCGQSMFPVAEEHLGEIQNAMSVICPDFPEEMKNWTSFEAYKKGIENVPSALNFAVLTGHCNLRTAVMGLENRKPTDDELEQMKDLLRECMEQGSLGLSTGLIYAPSCYAETDEIVELAKVAAEYGGIYESHMRNESVDVCKSVEETLHIGREAGLPVVISHHKACGRPNWGKSKDTLRLVDEARANGQEVTIDQYPYLASMTHLKMCIPPRYFAYGPEKLSELLGDPDVRAKIKAEILDENADFENQYLNCGGWENIIIAFLPETPEYAGMTVLKAAEKMGKDPFEAYFDLMQKNGTVGNAIYFSMCEEDLQRIICHPDATVGSDGICKAMNEKAHPRAWGSFPHAICHFCKETAILTPETLIHKITQMAAERVGITDRGVIADGYAADLVLLDYGKLKDIADYIESNYTTEGIELVVVNGKAVYEDGKLTGNFPGKLLLHNPAKLK